MLRFRSAPHRRHASPSSRLRAQQEPARYRVFRSSVARQLAASPRGILAAHIVDRSPGMQSSACMRGRRSSAASINASVAVRQARRSAWDFGSFWVRIPASRRVTSGFEPGTGIGQGRRVSHDIRNSERNSTFADISFRVAFRESGRPKRGSS